MNSKYIAFATCLLLLCAREGAAQGVNYMDEAGNLFFVERLEDVPVRFRTQIVKPTPTPDLSPRDQKKYETEKRKAELQIEKKKRKELKEKERIIAKERKLLEKKKKKLDQLRQSE